ncbi:MAG: biopolymer transporter ExbD [candidate division KSB1 bacterium]|nr:biopolymer transporter ExbD [candidate division KSB1 bacterium]MDZ7274543.1 biopolymer transporter ExbD [candidate division KSB1 bacterium]MDZ7284796.1 biopolymer transporter ExbD [candidate division KSB1 bacterium]MDZ7297784.1 biopolymer transporter ExbD [candidate division KSB1 bacterium]MDZ7306427.1 biopolymer transporter ExbD [candidate division KSB1 bacterium]
MLQSGASADGLKKVGRRKRELNMSLRLTSMMDMFTILLVFLLKSFSAEGQFVTVSPELTLPKSTSTIKPKVAPIVAVTKEWVMLDDKPLVKIDDIDLGAGLQIPALQQSLQFSRSVAEKLGAQEERFGFQGKVVIMSDRDMPFAIIKRVMATCGATGYNNMELLVYGNPS